MQEANNGWIKLYRKLVDWEWYTDSATKDLFIHLLLTANHTERQWRGTTINKGELVTSVASLSAETGLTPRQIRTAISHLEATNEIKRKATNKNTLIIVVNYALYQGMEYAERQTNDKQNDKQATNKRQTSDKPTNKNVKNERIKEDVDEIIYSNISNLKILYPDVDWDAYDEEEFNPEMYHSNVLISPVQYDLLLDKLGLDRTNHYLKRMSEWQSKNNTTISNAYAYILKWAKEDKQI